MGSVGEGERERIRALLREGLSSAEIARRLGVPTMRVAAVKAHVTMGTYGWAIGPEAAAISAGSDEVSLSPVHAGAQRRTPDLHGDPDPSARNAASVGIDVAEARRGLDVVALDQHGNVVESRGRLTVDEAVDATMALRPLVVCIDSPSGWSTSGRSRAAERELARIGIQSYRTGPDPGEHPFYRWMRVGITLFDRLSDVYPLYRGGEVAGTAAEIFPHATSCLLAGVLRPPSIAKEEFRRRILRNSGIADDQLTTLDRVDAALGALTGLIGLRGGHSVVGDRGDGVILLPVPRVPSVPLPRAHPTAVVEAPGELGGPMRSDTSESGHREVPRANVVRGATIRSTTASPSARPMKSLDFRAAATFIAAVPAGRWTSYKDVATAAGNERGAQAVGEWLRRRGHEVPHVYRVIRSGGFVAENFRAAGPGVPADAPSARDLLRREGIRFDLHGRASQQQRFQPHQ